MFCPRFAASPVRAPKKPRARLHLLPPPPPPPAEEELLVPPPHPATASATMAAPATIRPTWEPRTCYLQRPFMGVDVGDCPRRRSPRNGRKIRRALDRLHLGAEL